MAAELKTIKTDISLDDEIKLLQLELLRKQNRTEDDLESRRAAEAKAIVERSDSLKARHASMLKESLNTDTLNKRMQASCPHRKSNGEPDTGATHDYNQKLILVCQACGKTWKQVDGNLPQELINRSLLIGGPEVVT
jgi:rubrerythrin